MTRLLNPADCLSSQLLDLLLNVNDSSRVSFHLHYDLRSPTPDAAVVPELSPEQAPYTSEELESAHAALQEAKADLASGQIDHAAYNDLEASVSVMTKQTQSLARLSRLSHSNLRSVPTDLVPEDLTEASPTGYLSPSREEESLLNLDNYLDNAPPDADPLPPKPPRLTDREREKDAQLHNPMSVYNWLSNHRPKELSDDDSNHLPEKPSKQARKSPPKAAQGGGNKSSKRERPSSVAAPKPEEGMLDEDGMLIRGGLGDIGSNQRKRKRGGEDEAYRPKGGGSKKKRRSGAGVSSLAKKGDPDEEVD